MSDFFKNLTKTRFPDSESLLLGFVLLMMFSGFISIALSQVSLFAALMIFLFRWVRGNGSPVKTGLELSAVLLALWALLNIPFSSDWQTSLIFYRRFFLFTAIWIVASVINTERRRLLMLGFSLFGALAISLYGSVQMILKTGSLFRGRLDAMSNPMTSGSLLMMAVLLGAGFLLSGGQRRNVRWAVGAVLVPIILALLLTVTRSALLGLLGGFGVMFLLVRPRWFLVFFLLLSLGVGLLAAFGESILPYQFYDRVNPKELVSGTNTVVRLEMWRGGWQMVKEKPILGFGDCNLEGIAPDYYGDENTVYFGHLHNNLVQLAVIWGFPGLILGQFFVIAGLFLLVKRWRSQNRSGDPNPVLSGWILGMCGVWTGFFLAGFTEWYFGDAESMLIYLAFLGCALAPVQTQIVRPTNGN